MEKFYLELPTIERKQEALDYIQEHVDYGSNINGSGGLKDCLKGKSYEEWLDDTIKYKKMKYGESDNLVPSTTFFTIREDDNKIVGMVNLRHYLNDFLKNYGGHIGYGIRPTERRKGYAKIQLYLVLIEAQKLGIDKVMVDCDKTNIGSEKTILALGGEFEREVFEKEKNVILRNYWIDVNKSIEKHRNEYDQYISKEIKGVDPNE